MSDSLVEEAEDYVLLPEGAAVHRVIHPDFNVVDEGRPSSACLRPTKKDAAKLSVDRADMRQPKESFEAFVGQGYKAFAVITVAPEHCQAAGLARRYWPLPENSAHSFIDYRNLSNGQVEKKAKALYKAWQSAGSSWSYQRVPEASMEGPVPKSNQPLESPATNGRATEPPPTPPNPG